MRRRLIRPSGPTQYRSLRILRLSRADAAGKNTASRLAAEAALTGAQSIMSHKHANLLHTLFQDPISGNIHWREVESLLRHLGADIEQLSGARLRVKLNGAEGILHRPHHSNVLDRSGVKHLREYLAHARMTPSLYDQRH